ncbi:MSC_0882 family membrane protein [Mycoplasma putrefaciens]|uniref:Uncharacterized protein n=1 Tax=Mycoplasma putrefaciens (strain ATCC 15718 / NCTC 10155 / C30 KS-1 / KS-1) TaxID=743965 RepID=A0A7U3ZSJ0_MYCPK|nr:hypothetical protein [Mycoplasma putrefaciens]AEM68737.1 uncharacterized protein MPUT_0360 [Mycoplasma putrefaciens KS1]
MNQNQAIFSSNNLLDYNDANNSEVQQTQLKKNDKTPRSERYKKRRSMSNFSKKALDEVEMPSQIAKEIRMEKYKILAIQLIGVFLIVAGTFFLVLHFVDFEKTNLFKIPKKYIPNPIVMGFVAAIGLIICIIQLIEYKQLIIGVRTYKINLLLGKDTIPFFLIKQFRLLIKRPIYINWFCGTVYLYGSIAIGIMFGVNEILKLKNKEQIITEIIVLGVILAIVLLFHIVSLISIKWRKGNIISYYGYEIIDAEEIKQLKQEAKRLSMIIFFIILAIVLFAVIIPYLIIRKRRTDKPLWSFL